MTRSHYLVASLAGCFAAAGVFFGCATTPKPQELVALDELRKSEQVEQATEKHAQLMRESEDAYKKAMEAWEDEELDEAKHWAVIGTIKLRTALALLNQAAAKQRVAAAEKALKQASRQRADLVVKIRETDEKIELYGKLAQAKQATLEREKALTEAQRLSEAQKKVADAQLALKRADTVNAKEYAQATYALAQELLIKADAALKANSPTEASSSAAMAEAKAAEAYAASRGPYQQAQANASQQVRNQALQRDAAAIPGITVRLKTVGQTQQLMLPVLDLFKRGKTSPRDEKLGVINAVGELLKKYPSYPVIINGYTSSRVRRSQRYAVSQARAQAIANHFVTMGQPLKRFAVAGRGDESPVARAWSSANDRVEIILLFQ